MIKRKYTAENIWAELEEDMNDLLKELQESMSNISVSSEIYATTMSVHINDEIVYSGGALSLNGFLEGLIVAFKIKI